MEFSNKIGLPGLGVCYYPEHWPEEQWPEDLRTMQENGISVIRVAEFAWSKLEPREGEYTFAFWDRFMDVAQRSGIHVIFCTPTATPSAWLTHKYPEVLNAGRDGGLHHHGMRRHCNYTSPVYRDFTKKIVHLVGKRYSGWPCVIGWQIDNELNCGTSTFYAAADHAAFRMWLQQKYGTLDALNEAWGTIFWNQTYTAWDEVFLSRPHGEIEGVNPHLALDEKRFFSHSAVSYCKLQYDILRQYTNPGQFITTNGMFGHLDYGELTRSAVDVLTYDSYPAFGFESMGGINNKGFDDSSDAASRFNLNDRKWGWFLANARAFSPVFGVMEQQSGAGGWVNRMKMPTPRPGQLRLWSFQSLANGADFVSYFRWRTATFGTEIYWHGILGYDGSPNRRLTEVRQVAADFARLGELAGAESCGRVAILRDYDNLWDGEFDIWHGELRAASEVAWFVALELTHTPWDVVYITTGTTPEALARYDLVVAPHPTILEEGGARALEGYVRQGGTLIVGARSGYKDRRGHCHRMPMPGYLAGLCGVRVEDFSALCYKDRDQAAVWDEALIQTPLFNDILDPISPETKVLATYRGNYYDGRAAFTSRLRGKGHACYFGAAFQPEAAMLMLNKLGFAKPLSSLFALPESCALYTRRKGETIYHFLLNFADDPVTITVKKAMRNLLDDALLEGERVLAPYDVLVLRAEGVCGQ